MAVNAFRDAGWFGHGLGEGFTKARLPDAHNDFVFAAVAEEMGIAACLFLILIYGLIVWRALSGAFREQETFVRLAAAGLVMIFGLQALINMAVNLNLLPAKGVTLPFVSYGRSSLLATAITLGMIVALTKRSVLKCASQALPGVGGLAMTPGRGDASMSRGSIMLTAGGTGGHLFPAQALCEEMVRRGYEADLITDTRGNLFGGDFPARKIYKVAAATFHGRSPSRRPRRLDFSETAFRPRTASWGKRSPKRS